MQDGCAGGEVIAGGRTRSYSRRAAGPAPSVPHLRWQGTPPGAGACEGLAREEHDPTFRGAGPSRTTASDTRTKDGCRIANNPSAAIATGGVPRLEEGASGRNHGTARVGKVPPRLPLHRPRQRSLLSLSEPGVRGRHVPASAISSSAIFNAASNFNTDAIKS